MSHKNTWRKVKCILLSERSPSEKAAYCIIPNIWHSGKGKTMETIVRKDRGATGRTQRIFRAVKLLCMSLRQRVHVIIHLSKLKECITPWVNPNENYGLWVIMMDQYKFLNYNNVPPWWGILIMRVTMHV